MWKKLFTPEDGGTGKKQAEVSSWDVVVLSFKLMFQQIQFWIRPNIWMVLLSVPVITGPGAKAALYQTVQAGLRDPALTRTDPRQEVKTGFHRFIWRALGLSLLKWLSLFVILTATFFWVTQETWLLRSVSVVTLYFLVMWWLSVGYLYPVLVGNPEMKILKVVKEAVMVAIRRPFDSLLFAVVSTLLLAVGVFLLGPILLIVPALRSLIHLQGYWFLTRQVVPGFEDLVEYTEKYYD